MASPSTYSVSRKRHFVAVPQRYFADNVAARYLYQLSLTLVAYLVAGKLGQATTAIRSSNLGPVWPAYGVALAAILVWGYRVCPAILVAAFVVAFFSPVPHIAALGQAAGATLAATTGAFFLLRFAAFRRSLSRLPDALNLIVFGGFGSALISATLGVLVLYATHVEAYRGIGSAWLIYWLGDATGVLLVTPLALRLSDLRRVFRREWAGEIAVLFLLLTLACIVVFGDLPVLPVRLHFMAFAVLPFVMWAAIRFGMGVTALSMVVVATIATVETALGSGPFARNDSFQDAVLLDVFFSVLSVSGLSLAAVIEQRKDSEHKREELVREQAAMQARIEAQELERSRIGRELHDDINQRLAILALELQQLQDDPSDLRVRMQDLQQETVRISEDIQALSHELHSSKLQFLGVLKGLRSWCREFGERQRIEINFSGDVSTPIGFQIGICLFRVTQEALHNVAKHSEAQAVEVRLYEISNEIHLVIKDEGKGFDMEGAKAASGSGLASMQERARLVNGTIAIESKPMKGTTIHVRVPFKSEEAGQRAAQ